MSQSASAADRQTIEQFNAAVLAKQAEPGFGDRRVASVAVAKPTLRLHRRFVAATNPGVGQRRALGIA